MIAGIPGVSRIRRPPRTRSAHSLSSSSIYHLRRLQGLRAIISETEKLQGQLEPPSSKNYTTRYLLATALADGDSVVDFPASSADADALIACLRQFGAVIEEQADASGAHLKVRGFGAHPQDPGIVNPGNAGAVLRLLMGVGAPSARGRISHRPRGIVGATTSRGSAGCVGTTGCFEPIARGSSADCAPRRSGTRRHGDGQRRDQLPVPQLAVISGPPYR